MNKYRAVILILSSNNNEVYINARRVWKKYMNNDPSIKVFFVYGKIDGNLEDFDPSSDIILPHIEEEYPLYIRKTVEAIELIDSIVEYDFFIRTNISTFWDFKNLHRHLDDLPKERCYSGDGPLPGYNKDGYYLSGTDTIVTPEMIKSMISNKDKINFGVVEDSAMGLYFNGVLGVPMLPNRICFFEDITSVNEVDNIRNRIIDAQNNNRDHYRVKTLNGDRTSIDIFIYTILLKIIYDITI